MNFFKNLEIRDKKILFSFIVVILFTFLIDSKLTLFIFELNEPFKSFFHTATKFGDSFYYLIIIVLLFFILRVKKNISPIFKNLYDLNTFVFYNIMLSGIVTQILKHIVGRPRPKMLLSEYQSFDINLLSFNSNFHSFPSGHTSTIFSIVFVFYFLFPVIKKYIISLGIFIALTRLIIGAHYLSDVIAGCAVSYFVFIFLRDKFLIQERLFIREKDILPNTHINQIGSMCLNFFKGYYSKIIVTHYYLKYFLLIISISII